VNAPCYAGLVRGIRIAVSDWASLARLDKLKLIPRGACFSLPAGRQPGQSLRGTKVNRAVAFSILLLLTAGCGYIGQPLVPLANVPQRISDLAAVERGAVIIAHFTIPTFTTENNPIKTSVNLDFRAGVAGDPFNPGDWANEAKLISQFEVKDGLATFKIPTEAWTGKKVTISVRSIGSNRKRSDWSNFETLLVVNPPETPSKPAVDDVAAGERVTWTGAGDQFRVLRRVGDEKDFAVAATVKEHEWTDTGIDYGEPYSYAVQALMDAGNQKMAESDISASYTQVPKDSFPPAVPSGLRADRTANSVSLVWEADTDSDLAGYRIYRSEGNAPWQKLADVNTVPSYSDAAVEHRKTYHYAISAFDKTDPPNESQHSAPVEMVFP